MSPQLRYVSQENQENFTKMAPKFKLATFKLVALYALCLFICDPPTSRQQPPSNKISTHFAQALSHHQLQNPPPPLSRYSRLPQQTSGSSNGSSVLPHYAGNTQNQNNYQAQSLYRGHAQRAQAQSQGPQQVPQPQHRLPSVCQIPDELRPIATCRGAQDADLKLKARNEFRLALVETSSELNQLLTSHLHEFRSHALGLILLARSDTLNKLRQFTTVSMMDYGGQQSHQQFAGHQQQMEAVQLATQHLFNSMYTRLANYQSLPMSQGESLMDINSLFQAQTGLGSRPLSHRAGSLDLGQELANYFRRLHLIHLKRALEERASLVAAGAGRQADRQPVELDLDCLDNNLASQTQIETLVQELQAASGVPAPSYELGNDLVTSIKMEQARLSLAIKQSVEFARTLLSSLNLASEMFSNLTGRSDDWLPGPACQAALSRMTVCQKCHVTSAAQADLPPCENYCLNVARGCMNDLYELNRFWSDHVNALARFKTNMIRTNNIENVMSKLDIKLIGFMAKLQQYSSQQAAAQSSGNTNKSNPNAELPVSSEVSNSICPFPSARLLGVCLSD